ncbi:MAG TPA: selenocysteine-specific translation elongation factor [Gemmatimonadaceae bacterium]|nr:selenocysteine-specific translation elongation factor [Gemmatimonadaceae bacterium]
MILGTAGHVDHGKTALVRALTGVDTDRLPEEKRRGITIELGFAPLVLDGAGTLGVVDVPGHEAFVRTMLAGATGVDLALLVIASDEGVMPQTREHLAILGLLGVSGGVVALTKSDLVEPEWLSLVETDVRDLLRGSPLEHAPIVACSAVTGDGLEALRSALAAAARAVPTRDDADLARMPIDRSFSVRGTGTVVTGTLWSGAFTADSTVRVLPSGRTARVRSLESHGAAVTRALPGSRVAVALGGLDREDVTRGDVLVHDGDEWSPSSVLRADVALLDDSPSLGVRTRVRFHLGTLEVGARIVAVGGRLEAGTARTVVPVRISLDRPVVARAGDRFVLRTASPALTIGGGVVTDSHPPTRRAKPWPEANANTATRLSWIVDECAGAGLALRDLPVRIGVRPAESASVAERSAGVVRVADRVYSKALRASVATQLVAMVKSRHDAHPLEPGLSLQHARERLNAHEALVADVLAELCARHVLEVRASVIALANWRPGSGDVDADALDTLHQVLVLAGSQPPSVDELGHRFGTRVLALLRALERQGRAVAVAPDRYFSPDALEAMVAKLRATGLGAKPRTASEIKESLGLTRKFMIPFLEYCDRIGVTVRSGDTRTVRPKA